MSDEVESSLASPAASPASYFPLANGRYEVKPGLALLGTDYGNGAADNCVFQIDSHFWAYRQAKLAARAESLSKYYQTHQLMAEVEGAIAQLICDRLVQEYPQYFCLRHSPAEQVFHSRLTDETFYLNQDWQLHEVQGKAIVPSYASILDALALQMQEDWAVVCRDGERNWISAIHLCFPNYWAAAEKIGREFAEVHGPVAGMERINARSPAIVKTMITRPPMVRFAWGLTTDTRLNHHPEPPAGITWEDWQGRQFHRADPHLYLRIERQVIWGLPDQDAALFTIRTYFRDCQTIKQDPTGREQLSRAIASMTPASVLYKGLTTSKTDILAWLHQD